MCCWRAGSIFLISLICLTLSLRWRLNPSYTTGAASVREARGQVSAGDEEIIDHTFALYARSPESKTTPIALTLKENKPGMLGEINARVAASRLMLDYTHRANQSSL